MDSPEDIFCPLPWLGIYASTNGTFRPCSVSRGFVEDARAFPESREFQSSVRNSDFFKNLRTDFLAGRKNSSCDNCWKSEASGLTSFRHVQRSLFKNDLRWARSVSAEDGLTSEAATEFFDIRPGNGCNLKCRMCSAHNSSLWASDHEFLTGERFDASDYQWFEDPARRLNVLTTALKSLESREEITFQFAGGEPLLSKSHLKFLDDCAARGIASRIHLRYQTNATVLSESIFARWKDFASVQAGVSIDGVREVNDYIRFPSVWKILEANLDRLLGLDFVYVWVQPCVSLYNVHHVPEILEWCQSKQQLYRGEISPLEVRAHIVHDPSAVNIQALPPAAMDYLKELYMKFGSTEVGSKFQNFLAGLLTYAEGAKLEGRSVETLHSFWSYTRSLDERRGQSFSASFPVWNEVLNSPGCAHSPCDSSLDRLNNLRIYNGSSRFPASR